MLKAGENSPECDATENETINQNYQSYSAHHDKVKDGDGQLFYSRIKGYSGLGTKVRSSKVVKQQDRSIYE